MRRALIFCLFASGAAGLIDEVVWGRGVAVLLGATATAHALTLAVFLGGLALGAALFGRLADRSQNPLRLYAILEVGIALTTAATPAALRAATAVFVKLASPLYPEHATAVTALKLVASIVLLLPATLLMGGTLPVVVRALQRLGGEVGGRVSVLYAANSAGAVIGAIVGGIWLTPAVGLDRCAVLAATLNVLAAAVALWPGVARPGSAAVPPPLAKDFAPARVLTAVRVAMLVSGFSSLLYETLWIRVLSLILGGTAHAFPLMLASFIGGITIGAHVAGRRQRTWREAAHAFARVEVAAAVAVALAFGAYERLPFVDLLVSYGLAWNGTGYAYQLIASFTICAAVMAVPAIAIGATLPLAATIGAADPENEGKSLGNIYAWNTIGNVLGASVGGLLVLPLLGLQGSFVVGGILNAGAGLLPILSAREGASARRPAILAGAATLLLVLTPTRPELLSRGTFRLRGANPGSWRTYHQDYLSNLRVLFHADGATATVEVQEHLDDVNEAGKPTRTLKINGKPDASTRLDMQTQLGAGHLPMLLHPDPKNVLIVGYGSGVTVGAVLAHGPDVKVTVIEISPEVVRAGDAFADVNHGAAHDPRVTIRVDDARTFVRLTREKYDVVISEPSNPWMPGIAGLFTDDFFRDAKRVLAPGGVFVQWSQLYETNDDIIRTVVRTCRSAFPDATAWGFAGADMLLLAGVDPAHLDWKAVAAKMSRPEVARSLEGMNVTGAAGLAALQMFDPEGLHAYGGEGPLQTDAWPWLEYAGAYALFASETPKALMEADQRLHWPAPPDLAIAAFLGGRAPSAEEAASVAKAVSEWTRVGPRLPVSARRRAAELDSAQYPALVALLEKKYPDSRTMLAEAPPPTVTAPEELAAWAREIGAAQLAESSAFRPPKLAGAKEALQRAIDGGLADATKAKALLEQWSAVSE